MKQILMIIVVLCSITVFGQNGKPKALSTPERAKPKVTVYVTSGNEGGLYDFVQKIMDNNPQIIIHCPL